MTYAGLVLGGGTIAIVPYMARCGGTIAIVPYSTGATVPI